MSLRWKIVLILTGVSILICASAWLVEYFIVVPGFVVVEKDLARQDVTRCVNAIQRDGEYLLIMADDWATWDDTYEYMATGDTAYEAVNLVPSTFINTRLTLMALVDTSGKMRWGQTRDPYTGEVREIPGLLDGLTGANNPLMTLNELDSQRSGLLMTAAGPMLVAVKPITHNDRSGPVQGSLIMGRLLDDLAITDLSSRVQVQLSLLPLGDVSQAADRRAMDELAVPDAVTVHSVDAGMNLGHALLRDVFDKPALLLRAQLPRQVSLQGARAAHLGTFTNLGGAMGILAILGAVLGHAVVRPLGRMTRHALRIGQADDLSARLAFVRRDEIGTLAGEFDRMVERLADSRQELLTIARRAGMAEVATDVLHNVGNVLNSVNVSVNMLAAKLRDSEIDTLCQLTRLVGDHADNLPDFLSNDARGRQIPQFLGQLTRELSGEHTGMMEEMKSLAASVEHIKQVVQSQQASACNEQLVELVDPAGLVEEAIRLNGESCERHGIRIIRDFEPVPPVLVDRHKLLSILVNLTANARQALKAGPRDGRRLMLGLARAEVQDRPHLVITVTDTGVGIAPENLERIFSFGFSTRSGGRGFGLHAVANTAAELGGTIAAASEGLGHGARFTLTVPVEFKESPCRQMPSRQPAACL